MYLCQLTNYDVYYRGTMPINYYEFNCYQHMEPQYTTIVDDETEESQMNSVLPAVALYLGMWVVSIGTFSYSYMKIKNKNNLFTRAIDKCVGLFYIPPTQYEKLMKQIQNFDKTIFYNVLEESWDMTEIEPESEDEIGVTESDEEYLKSSKGSVNELSEESETESSNDESNDESSENNDESNDESSETINDVVETKPNRIEAILNQIIENTSNVLRKKQENVEEIVDSVDNSEKIKKQDEEIGKEVEMVNYKELGYDIIDSE